LISPKRAVYAVNALAIKSIPLPPNDPEQLAKIMHWVLFNSELQHSNNPIIS